MVLYCSHEDLGLSYEQRTTHAKYFELLMFLINNDSISLFLQKDVFRRLFKQQGMSAIFDNRLEPFQQNSPYPLMLLVKFGWSWPRIFRGDTCIVWKCVLMWHWYKDQRTSINLDTEIFPCCCHMYSTCAKFDISAITSSWKIDFWIFCPKTPIRLNIYSPIAFSNIDQRNSPTHLGQAQERQTPFS